MSYQIFMIGNEMKGKSPEELFLEQNLDFATVEKQIDETSYGVVSVLPKYIRDTIDEQKVLSSRELKLNIQNELQELFWIKRAVAKDEKRKMATAPEHVRKLFEKQDVSIMFDKALFERGLRECKDAEILDNAEVIRAFIELQRGGLPKSAGAIYRAGFWRSRLAEEIRDKSGLVIPATDRRRFDPPSCIPWWEKKTWEVMMTKILKQCGEIWEPIRVKDILQQGPLNFPVVQKEDVRVCTSFVKHNNSLIELEKIRLLGARAVAEILSRFSSKNATGHFSFRGKKDVNDQVSREKEVLKAMHQGEFAVANPFETRSVMKPSEFMIEDGESTEFIPGAFIADFKGWYHQTPIDEPRKNASWIPIPSRFIDNFKKALGPRIEIVKKVWRNQERYLDGVDRVEVFGEDAVLNFDGSVDITVFWLAVTSCRCLFGDLGSVHGCLGRSEQQQFAMNVLMKVVTTIWVDDAHGHMRRGAIKQAYSAYVALSALMGRRLSEDKTEMITKVQEAITALGLGYELVRDDRIRIYIPKEKVKRYQDLTTKTILDIRGVFRNPLIPVSRFGKQSCLLNIVKNVKEAQRLDHSSGTAAVVYYEPRAKMTKNKTLQILDAIEVLGQEKGWHREQSGRQDLFFVDAGVDASYHYGGKEHKSVGDLPAEIGSMARQIGQKFGVPKTFRPTVVVNKYESEQGRFPGIPMHDDGERLYDGIRNDALVVAVSLGDAAEFRVRLKGGVPDDDVLFYLVNASMLVMSGKAQKFYLHGIDRRLMIDQGPGAKELGRRMSITFRWIPDKHVSAKGYSIKPVVRRTTSGDDLNKIVGLYRWCAQLERSANLFAGCVNVWMQETFFDSHIKKVASRKSLIQILLRFEQYILDHKGIFVTVEDENGRMYHSMADASGEFEEVQRFQKENPSVEIPQQLILDAEIWVGGFVRFACGEGQTDARAWRFQVRNLPKWLTDVTALHIGIFEMLGVLLSLKYAVAIGMPLQKATVVQHIDNISDVYILVRAATKCKVTRAFSIALFDFLGEREIGLYPAWISGVRNIMADAAGRTSKLAILKKQVPNVTVDSLGQRWFDFWLQKVEAILTEIEGIDAGGQN